MHLPSKSSYQAVLNLQKYLYDKVTLDPTRNFLLTLEHNPVYTIGIRKLAIYDDSFSEKLKYVFSTFSTQWLSLFYDLDQVGPNSIKPNVVV